jgi:hypothetical protein
VQRERRLRARPGFSLVELIVVTVLLTIVGGALMGFLGKQQQFYQGTGDVIDMRTQLRQAAFVMGSDLRALSSVGGDIVTMTDTSIDFRYNIGSSVVCSKPSSSTLIIPPTSLVSGAVLTSWLSQPAANDSVYIFDDGSDSTTSSDDSWKTYKLNAIANNVGGCATSTGYTAAGDAGSTSYTLTTGSNYSGTIMKGSAIRFWRRAHYSLYRAGDGLWYLGYCSPTCASNAIQPLAGPFLSFVSAGSTSNGMTITYADSAGNTTATAANVARVSIVFRGQTKGTITIPGMAYRTQIQDSLRTIVALRNRS